MSTQAPAPTGHEQISRQVTWKRLAHPRAAVALVLVATAAVAQALGAVVAGRLAQQPDPARVGLLAVLLIGGVLLTLLGRVLWTRVCDLAEGRLRADLLTAVLHQPLPALGEQAVGELLDRVDDDTRELGTTARQSLWFALQTLLAVLPMWVVAGLTWWPAWIAFPLMTALTWAVLRRPMSRITPCMVAEEEAWTDHAAVLEEGIAARDDVRTSLGRPYLLGRLAARAQEVHHRFRAVVGLQRDMLARSGLVLHGLLAATAVAGALWVAAGGLGVARLVTVYLLAGQFAAQVGSLAHRMPELQAGVGAMLRLRQVLAVPPEPAGGRALPDGPLDLDLRDLHFAYGQEGFALDGIDLHLPAGSTLALVGRSGSGKSTLASLVSRAVEPEPGTVLLGGVDVREIDLQQLRSAVGVVTQRTEILAATLEQNITLFGDVPRERVEQAVDELGLGAWVAGLPDGLDTLLGPGGTSLSAGEEQLVAFARLLVRDVRLVVLDEATARMDPLTEARVTAAAERLLTGRTGILVAHRLSTTARADLVAVLDHGRLAQAGPRAELAARPGPFRDLLRAAGGEPEAAGDAATGTTAGSAGSSDMPAPGVGSHRRSVAPLRSIVSPPSPPLRRAVARAAAVRPRWGLLGALLFLLGGVFGGGGVLTGRLWGDVVEALQAGQPAGTTRLLLLTVFLLLGPVAIAAGMAIYPRWWVEVLLRVRQTVLHAQTAQRRLPRDPAGEVVARAMDTERFVLYVDRWVDLVNGVLIAVATALVARSLAAGLVLLAVLAVSAGSAALGRPVAGRSAAAASAARARFGRALASVLESVRTVKLAGRTPQAHAHLRQVDAGRVDAAVREHRVAAVLDGVPPAVLQAGVVVAWAAHAAGRWDLSTTLLVTGTVAGFEWFGRVAGAVVTETPGVRAWYETTGAYAGGALLTRLPEGVDLVAGRTPDPGPTPSVEPLERLELRQVGVVHDDGTVGVEGVDLTLRRGELVLLLGPVGSGKSSLLGALAGLLDHTGEVRWNGRVVDDPETFLRPVRVAHVAQVPRVLSGTFAQNVRLGYDRPLDEPVAAARLAPDMADAGGPDALVGHRGVRLSGGQVQRLALARALATRSELLLADDVSSALDAATELELWAALRGRGTTVLGATSKRSALATADRVVVLREGRVVAVGPWRELEAEHGGLAG